MLNMRTLFRSAAAVAVAILIAFAASAMAADILDDWATAKAPPPPELKPVTVDGSTTALLVLDMMKANCGARPRCVASVPAVKKLHEEARKAGMMVWYSFVGSNGMATTADQIDPALTAKDGEWVRQNGPDKFIGSNLDEKAESARDQDGHRMRHFVSRRGHRHRRRRGAARLQSDHPDRLPVLGRYVYGTICGVPSLQGRTGRRHQPSNRDAQLDDQVLIHVRFQPAPLTRA